MSNEASEAAEAGQSPAQQADAASTPGEPPVAADETGGPMVPDEALEASGGAPAASDGEMVITSETMNVAQTDEDGWPAGSIPYEIDGVRVSYDDYVAHLNEEARAANLAQLQADSEGFEPPTTTEE